MKTKNRFTKQLLSIFLSIAMLLSLVPSFSLTAFAAAANATVTIDNDKQITLKDDDGDNYYEIGTADELYAFAALVIGGNTGINGELIANITINTNVLKADGTLNTDTFRSWTPIGNGTYQYTGFFDGNGKTISGIYINGTSSHQGLFGYVGSGGKVKNVRVVDSYICGSSSVGGIVGENCGTVEGCTNNGDVSAQGKQSHVGGVVGHNDVGTVEGCTNNGKVSAKGNESYVGGVVGCNYNKGTVRGTVQNCTNNGKVSAENYSTVGGVVGFNKGPVLYCYNTGDVSTPGAPENDDYADAGGVVGLNDSGGTVKNCYNIGNVSKTGYRAYVGGVVGFLNGYVWKCYFNSDTNTGNNAIGYKYSRGIAENVESKTYAQFASGEVAYLLGDAWGQTLSDENKDEYPVFANDSNKVYQIINNGCKSYGAYLYSNSNNPNDVDVPEHAWSYQAEGNTISEKCGNVGCGINGGSVTLTAPTGLVYGDGETTTASVSGSFTTGAEIPTPTYQYKATEGGTYAEFSGTPTDAGTYKASITVNTDTTVSVEYTIEKADISGATVTLNPTSGTYTGSEQKPTISVVWNNKTLEANTDYTVSWDKNGFTDAGDYTVTVTGKDNFTGTKTPKFTINDAEITDIEVEQTGKLVYTGDALKPNVSANAIAVNGQEITFRYSMEKDGNYGKDLPSFTEAGQYTVWYQVSAPNHTTPEPGSFTVTVDKATVTEPTITSKTYTGSTLTADISNADLYIVTQNNGGTDAGKYDVVLKLTDNKNYKWASDETGEEETVTLKFEITQAKNEWLIVPSISGWTYGEEANRPSSKAKFGEATVQYYYYYDSGHAPAPVSEPTQAGIYTAYFSIDNTNNYKGLTAEASLTIAKADQDRPNVQSTNETISGKQDGEITGVDSTMEYRKEGDATYTAITNDTIANLAAGKYYVRYKEKNNYNPSPDTEVTIAAGRKLTVKVPSADDQIGYTMTTTTPEIDYWGSIHVEFKLLEGYSMTDNFEIFNGTEPTWRSFNKDTGVLEFNFVVDDFDLTVQGVEDITAPTAEIEIATNKWNTFLNSITFGLFFKETQSVTITAEDVNTGSGLEKVYYYLASEKLTEDAVKALADADWTEYTDAFNIDPSKEYIIYAKAVDKAGNATYVSSDGVVLDAIAPVINGVEDGGTYYGNTQFSVDESYIDTVTVDENKVDLTDGKYTITADGKEHTIVVTDKAGNDAKVKITVIVIATLDDTIENIKTTDVKSSDKEDVEEVLDLVNSLIDSGKDFTDEEDQQLSDIKSNAEALIKKIDDAAAATDTKNTQKVEDVTADNVTPDNKTNLEGAKADLEKALEDNSGNYTEDEKKAIEEEIKRIDDALTVIENVEAAEELIDKLPDTIKKDDEAAIKAADDAYNALSDYEKSLVDKDAKKALDDAKAALAELNKPADSTSPNTGDNSNLWLWIALLFISGGALFTLTVVDKKRKTVK